MFLTIQDINQPCTGARIDKVVVEFVKLISECSDTWRQIYAAVEIFQRFQHRVIHIGGARSSNDVGD